jgi:hypothetical protein
MLCAAILGYKVKLYFEFSSCEMNEVRNKSLLCPQQHKKKHTNDKVCETFAIP